MKKTLLSIITLTFLAGVCFAPLSTNAQAAGGANAVVDGASCSVSQVVSNAVRSVISGAISKIGSSAAQKVAPIVPNGESGQLLGNSNVDTNAHTGGGFSVFGITINFLPSWDAIAYCIGNAVITWVADGVTQWINSGFDGNPAFVNDPEQFFTDLANETAAGFVAGVVKGTVGINICQPFRLAVGLSALDSYNSNYNNLSKCTLQTASNNIQGFLSGAPEYFSFDAFYTATQNPANNYWESVQLAQNELRVQIDTKSTLAHDMLLRNNGYQDVVQCQWQTVQEKGADGKTFTATKPVPGTCKTVVTGSDTQKAGQDSRNMANLRLVAATKFDQVITALVNQLIKRALNELLTSSNGSTR